jgi:hypothetical protein
LSRAARAAALIGVLALASCGGDDTRAVRPKLFPLIDTQDFGTLPVLNAKRIDIPMLNVGRGMLTVKSAAILEPGTAFEIVEAPVQIQSGEEKPLGVVFVPPTEQDFQATLVLETDDLDNQSVRITLLGRGSTQAIMEVEPLAIPFGRVAEGTSAVKSFTIRSLGTADLIVESIAFAEGSAPAFEFLGSVNTPAVVPMKAANGLPGQILVSVRYTVFPGAEGDALASVRVRGTDPQRREVLVALTGQVNRAPVPQIAPLGDRQLAGGQWVRAPGDAITLDGSGSADPDGDLPLTYKWTLRSKPLGAPTAIAGPEQSLTEMTLDALIPGEYVVELNVTDAAGAKNLAPARASIVAAPAQRLLVEMFWNNSDPDIDLHFLRSPLSAIETVPDDCFFQNRTPDWGLPGVTSDDPELARDALVGFGPEVLGYLEPATGTYRVIAKYFNDHMTNDPAAEVTVRVYEFGVVTFERTKVLSVEGEVWNVADIEWPSGKITEIEQGAGP